MCPVGVPVYMSASQYAHCPLGRVPQQKVSQRVAGPFAGKRKGPARVLRIHGIKTKMEEIASEFHRMGSVMPHNVVIQLVIIILSLHVLRWFADSREARDGRTGVACIERILRYTL